MSVAYTLIILCCTVSPVPLISTRRLLGAYTRVTAPTTTYIRPRRGSLRHAPLFIPPYLILLILSTTLSPQYSRCPRLSVLLPHSYSTRRPSCRYRDTDLVFVYLYINIPSYQIVWNVNGGTAIRR